MSTNYLTRLEVYNKLTDITNPSISDPELFATKKWINDNYIQLNAATIGTDYEDDDFVIDDDIVNNEVFILRNDGTLVRLELFVGSFNTAIGVAVVTNECAFVIYPNNTDSSLVPWASTNANILLPGNVATTLQEFLSDFDGYNNTELQKEYSDTLAYACFRISFPRNYNLGYLGSSGEWAYVLKNYLRIQTALQKFGGTRLLDRYWTSTLSSERYAIAINLSTGSTSKPSYYELAKGATGAYFRPFAKIEHVTTYRITIAKSQTSGVTTKFSSDDSYTTNSKGKIFSVGESVTIQANVEDWYVFDHWEDSYGNNVSTNKSYTFTPTYSETYTAVYKVGISIMAEVGGKVSTTSSTSGAGSQYKLGFPGDTITMYAIPESSYQFTKWSSDTGALISYDTPYTYTIGYDTETIIAYFEKAITKANITIKLPTGVDNIRITQNPDMGEIAGTYTSVGTVVKEVSLGTSCTWWATASEGYTVSPSNGSFTVVGAKTISPTAVPIPYLLKVIIDNGIDYISVWKGTNASSGTLLGRYSKTDIVGTYNYGTQFYYLVTPSKGFSVIDTSGTISLTGNYTIAPSPIPNDIDVRVTKLTNVKRIEITGSSHPDYNERLYFTTSGNMKAKAGDTIRYTAYAESGYSWNGSEVTTGGKTVYELYDLCPPAPTRDIPQYTLKVNKQPGISEIVVWKSAAPNTAITAYYGSSTATNTDITVGTYDAGTPFCFLVTPSDGYVLSEGGGGNSKYFYMTLNSNYTFKPTAEVLQEEAKVVLKGDLLAGSVGFTALQSNSSTTATKTMNAGDTVDIYAFPKSSFKFLGWKCSNLTYTPTARHISFEAPKGITTCEAMFAQDDSTNTDKIFVYVDSEVEGKFSYSINGSALLVDNPPFILEAKEGDTIMFYGPPQLKYWKFGVNTINTDKPENTTGTSYDNPVSIYCSNFKSYLLIAYK